jgi:hypothetical protein
VANDEHLALLRQGTAVWNQWRERNVDILPDLERADLSCADFEGANLGGANLEAANLSRASLVQADLIAAILTDANLIHATLIRADPLRSKTLGRGSLLCRPRSGVPMPSGPFLREPGRRRPHWS